MRILHINAFDNIGGSAIAMRRLCDGLQKDGHMVSILRGFAYWQQPYPEIEEKLMPGRGWLARRSYELIRKIERRLGKPEGWQKSTRLIEYLNEFKSSEVVNLHNIHCGYFNMSALPGLARKKPMIWTLHDMWAMTGGCAFAYECERWKTGCFDCPQLKAKDTVIMEPYPLERDETGRTWRMKRDVYAHTRIQLVTPSEWLRAIVEKSILRTWPVTVIPNGIDTEQFKPIVKEEARQRLNLPIEGLYVLCAATGFHYRKGFDLLRSAIPYADRMAGVTVLAMGHGDMSQIIGSDIPVRSFGHVDDMEVVRLVMSSADLLAFPSRADNNPLVVMEAMACGTPVVAFDVGGVGELVHHEDTGYLARQGDVEDFGRGVAVLLRDKARRARMGDRSRKKIVSEFGIERQVQAYQELYRSVCSSFVLG